MQAFQVHSTACTRLHSLPAVVVSAQCSSQKYSLWDNVAFTCTITNASYFTENYQTSANINLPVSSTGKRTITAYQNISVSFPYFSRPVEFRADAVSAGFLPILWNPFYKKSIIRQFTHPSYLSPFRQISELTKTFHWRPNTPASTSAAPSMQVPSAVSPRFQVISQ